MREKEVVKNMILPYIKYTIAHLVIDFELTLFLLSLT